MSEPIFILAPTNAAKHARRVATDLSKLGFAVGGSDGRLRGAQLDKAHKVVLLWSGGAARGPALRAAARRAKANGKLVTVRIDATRPPSEAGRGVTLPRGRQRHKNGAACSARNRQRLRRRQSSSRHASW